MPPKKSGAQNRKAKKDKQVELVERKVGAGQGWLSQEAYLKASEQWDPNGRPWQLPIYGSAFPLAVRPVEQALLAFETGQFASASLLFDRMTRDDRVSAKAEERVDRLIGSDLEIEPADDSAQALTASEDLEKQVQFMFPSSQLTSLMMSALGLTVGVAQVKTTRVGLGMRIPTIDVWNNRNLYYDWLARQLIMITQNRGNLVVEEGDEQWLVWQPYGPWGWLRFGKVRSIAIPWLIRTWCRSWWARWAEVNGIPMRAGIIPMTRDPADEKIFLAQLANIGAEAVMRLPQGGEGNNFDVKLIEAAGKGWEGFERLLLHCDDSIAIAWLNQTQSTKGQGGLGSQENAGESTMVRITRKDALLSVALREQVLKPWCLDNYGHDKAPYLNWIFEPPKDESLTAKTDLSIAQSMVAFKSAGAPLDQRAYLTARGYGEQLLTEAEHEAQQQKAIEDAQQAMKPADGEDEGGDAPEQVEK